MTFFSFSFFSPHRRMVLRKSTLTPDALTIERRVACMSVCFKLVLFEEMNERNKARQRRKTEEMKERRANKLLYNNKFSITYRNTCKITVLVSYKPSLCLFVCVYVCVCMCV